MAAALTLSPEYPIPGEKVRVSFTGLDSATTTVKLFSTIAPDGSELASQIQAATKSRVTVHGGDSSAVWGFVPDLGGVYTFVLEEYAAASPHKGTFAGDTRGAPSPTIVASTVLTLSVGQRLSHTLGTSQDSAELDVFVWGASVLPTTLEQHGVVTPAIVNPSSEAAAAAVEDSAVVTALGGISGTASVVIGDLASVFASLRNAYQGHYANAVAHNLDDDVNTIGDGYVATSPKAAENSINELRRMFQGHLDNPEDLAGAGRPHDAVDGTNALVLSGASSDPATHVAALVDLWIAYSAHIALASPVHNSADVTNTAPALSPLMTLHRRFFEALANLSPSPPAATNSAVTTLATAGFKEA